MKAKILVVDDDASIRDVLKILLSKEGYKVIEASNAKDAINLIRSSKEIDLVVLDVMMPFLSGIEACRKIRKLSDVPILFLTAKSQMDDKSEAYTSGGDDYIVKPFSTPELLMKVNSLLRRYTVYKGKNAGEENADLLKAADGMLDVKNHCFVRGAKSIQLRDKEFLLLLFFIKNKGKVLDIKTIYEEVWNEKYLQSSANSVMVHIVNLRKKIDVQGNNSSIIRTVWGKGYKMDE